MRVHVEQWESLAMKPSCDEFLSLIEETTEAGLEKFMASYQGTFTPLIRKRWLKGKEFRRWKVVFKRSDGSDWRQAFTLPRIKGFYRSFYCECIAEMLGSFSFYTDKKIHTLLRELQDASGLEPKCQKCGERGSHVVECMDGPCGYRL